MNDDPNPNSQVETPPATASQEDDPYVRARQEVENLYGEALRDSQRQNLAAARALQEREAELERVRSTAATPPAERVSGADFLADPQTHIAEIVRKEVAGALRGINELAGDMRAKTKFSEMKTQFLLHERLGPLYKKVEMHVDNMLSTLPDDQLTPHAFQATILSTYGAAQAGLIPGFTIESAPPPNKETTVSTLPASPPNPNKPKVDKTPVKIELTESQRRVAKLQGLTDEEYIAMLDSDGTVDDMNKRLTPS